MNSLSQARSDFLDQYRTVRRAEGRGSHDPAYYRALPYQDLSGKNTAMWAMRARTYRFFESKLLAYWEKTAGRPLDILDLGAGNCWMSHRLKLRSHRPVALDIFSDSLDGLQAGRFYPLPLPAIEAEFDNLPFPPARFDLAIFNASLHYSTDYKKTLSEALNCLRPSGRIVVLDSPIYRSAKHGGQMVEERKARYKSQYGFASDSLGSIEYLDRAALKRLSRQLSIEWQIYRPWYGWRWHMRPVVAALKRRRPPSCFQILVGSLRSS